jgi:hypothetical protein
MKTSRLVAEGIETLGVERDVFCRFQSPSEKALVNKRTNSRDPNFVESRELRPAIYSIDLE